MAKQNTDTTKEQPNDSLYIQKLRDKIKHGISDLRYYETDDDATENEKKRAKQKLLRLYWDIYYYNATCGSKSMIENPKLFKLPTNNSANNSNPANKTEDKGFLNWLKKKFRMKIAGNTKLTGLSANNSNPTNKTDNDTKFNNKNFFEWLENQVDSSLYTKLKGQESYLTEEIKYGKRTGKTPASRTFWENSMGALRYTLLPFLDSGERAKLSLVSRRINNSVIFAPHPEQAPKNYVRLNYIFDSKMYQENLKALDLSYFEGRNVSNYMGEKFIKRLTEFKKLESLDLSNYSINDDDFPVLEKLTKLKSLKLKLTSIDQFKRLNEEMKHLSSPTTENVPVIARSLKELDLTEISKEFTDEQIAQLKNFNKLDLIIFEARKDARQLEAIKAVEKATGMDPKKLCFDFSSLNPSESIDIIHEYLAGKGYKLRISSGDWRSFGGCNLFSGEEEIEIPENMTVTEKLLFKCEYHRLSHLKIGKHATINELGIHTNNIKKLTIAEGATINHLRISECESLKDITIAKGATIDYLFIYKCEKKGKERIELNLSEGAATNVLCFEYWDDSITKVEPNELAKLQSLKTLESYHSGSEDIMIPIAFRNLGLNSEGCDDSLSELFNLRDKLHDSYVVNGSLLGDDLKLNSNEKELLERVAPRLKEFHDYLLNNETSINQNNDNDKTEASPKKDEPSTKHFRADTFILAVLEKFQDMCINPDSELDSTVASDTNTKQLNIKKHSTCVLL